MCLCTTRPISLFKVYFCKGGAQETSQEKQSIQLMDEIRLEELIWISIEQGIKIVQSLHQMDG
jgi:hypothetical protein